jgi:hypothetical protein
MITLTAEQAAMVRGVTVEGSALAPVPLTGGTFALAEKNAESPHRLAHRAFLLSLPTREISDDEISNDGA